MACTNFPNTGLVANVTTHTVGEILYKWTGSVWEAVSPPVDFINNLSLPYVFDTVGDMTSSAIAFPVGKQLSTKGYYAKGDGGGGDYIVVAAATGTADGGSYHNLASSLQAKLITDGTTNVKQFGAKGDGVADDTASIQAALNQFKKVEVPNGIFKITSTLYFNQGQYIFGHGQNSIIKLGVGVNTNMFFPNITLGTEGAPTSNSLDNAAFKNFTIDHNMTVAGDFIESVMSIVAISVKQFKCLNMEFKNPSGDSIYISNKYGGQKSTVVPYDIEISGCRFTGNNINRNAISVITASQVRISNNHFYRITKADMPCPIDLEPNVVTEYISNVVIDGNTFDNCKGGVSTYVTATETYDTIFNIAISNNTFTNPFNVVPYTERNQAYIWVYNAKNVQVTGNVGYNAYSVGYGASNSYGVSIQNNQLINPAEKGIYLEDVYNAKVDNNNILLSNDTYNGITCVGVDVITSGLILANNHAFEGGSLENNTITQTAAAVNSIGISLQGNVSNVSVSGKVSGFSAGLYVGKKADAYPTKLKVSCDLVDNTTPILNFSTGFVPDNNEWNCGKGVSCGKSAFSASSSKVISGLHVFPTSLVRVARIGSEGLANTLGASCLSYGQLTVSSSASESGEFLWEIVSP